MLNDIRSKNGISGASFKVRAGESLSDGTERGIRMDCGGKGVCGKCRVIVHPTEYLTLPTEAEHEHLTPADLAAGYRLACQVGFLGPAFVTVPDAFRDHRDVFGKEGELCPIGPDPLVLRIHLLPSQPPRIPDEASPSLVEWIAHRVSQASGEPVSISDPGILAQLSQPNAAEKELTLVRHSELGVTALLSGHRPDSLGVAFDIGTTTLAAYLCNLRTGHVLASAAAVNPQRPVGEDVISRIARCDQNGEGLPLLRRLVVDGLNGLVRRCIDTAGLETSDIDEVTVVGNTTMTQIFCGLHPHSIGVSPYRPTIREMPALRAGNIGLDLVPGTPVSVFPVVSGFVGGDTLAAVLADGFNDQEEMALLVDIGTNGELVLGNRDTLWATSCATGPALEGAHISCGMRATTGAIDQVALGPDGAIRWHVLGREKVRPLGLCGSGIIDALSVLRRAGGLDRSGRFVPGFPGVVCDDNGFGRRFVLVPADESGTGTDLVIDIKDVRQIQLAKAALAVGVEFLMEQVGVSGISKTVLTGSFGARFDWRSALVIGMLPKAVADGRVEPKMNLAGVGAAMGLVNRCHRRQAREILRRIRFVELASRTDFALRFAQATEFPDTKQFDRLWLQ